MALPKVSIVGRPNVGKSSIFNWLAGRRLAIVDNMAGVTRDRMTYMLENEGRYFEIVDTGGIGINDVDELDEEIEQQIEIGIQNADLLMFVVDVKDGKTGLDQRVAKRLRSGGKPFGNPVVCSAKNNRRRQNLVDAMLERLPTQEEIDQRDTEDPVMKFALVGRRNVGKSAAKASEPTLIFMEPTAPIARFVTPT